VQNENLQLQQCSQVTQNLHPNQMFVYLYRPEPALLHREILFIYLLKCDEYIIQGYIPIEASGVKSHYMWSNRGIDMIHFNHLLYNIINKNTHAYSYS